MTRDVAPYEIVGGNPSRTIRKRFADHEIAMLLEMGWWDWPDHVLRAAVPLITSPNIEALYAHWRSLKVG